MRTVETLVVGLGVMGSAALYHLARLGQQPVGLEQFLVGHSFGSSHGNSRAFRTFYHHDEYTALAEAALPMWQELERETRRSLLTLNGMLFFARPGNAAFERNLAVLQQQDTPHELLSPAQVAARFPALRLAPGRVACFTPRAGFLQANECVKALAGGAQQAGAVIIQSAAVERIDLSSSQPIVETPTGPIRCSRLILTPGPWAIHLLAGLPLRVTRQQKYYFRPRQLDLCQPERLPVYSDYDTLFYGFPAIGPGLKVADDHEGPPASPDTIDRGLDAPQAERLGRWLTGLLPQVETAFVESVTCMYTLTPDHDFVIGRHPDNANVILGAGFSGHGFKFAVLIGKILAELAVEGATRYPIGRFSPARFQPPAVIGAP